MNKERFLVCLCVCMHMHKKIQRPVHGIYNITNYSSILIAIFSHFSWLKDGYWIPSHHIWVQESRKEKAEGPSDEKACQFASFKKLSPKPHPVAFVYISLARTRSQSPLGAGSKRRCSHFPTVKLRKELWMAFV